MFVVVFFNIDHLTCLAKKKLQAFYKLTVTELLHWERDSFISVDQMFGQQPYVSLRDPVLQKAVTCSMSHLQAMNMILRKMLLTLGAPDESFSVYWGRLSSRTVELTSESAFMDKLVLFNLYQYGFWFLFKKFHLKLNFVDCGSRGKKLFCAYLATNIFLECQSTWYRMQC